VQEANADASVRVVVRPSRQYAFVAWNARRPPFDDARVRRALGLAIDRAEILATLRGDMGQLAAGPIPPYHWSYDPAIEPLPFAPDSARALLRAAGIADRDGDGLLDAADGRDFAFVLKLPSANSLNRDMSEMIASDLADIGVQVRIQPTEYGTLVGDLTGAARAFDAVLMGWESDFRIDLRGLFHSAELENPFQFAGYRNARVDSLIDRSAAEPDRDTARPLFAEIQQRVRDDQPWTFLYYYPDLYLRNERLRAVRMDIRGALVGVTDWWLAPESPAPSRSD
jgi:peptide/nickel transport system substrate-binding protein